MKAHELAKKLLAGPNNDMKTDWAQYNRAELEHGISMTLSRVVVEDDRGLRATGFFSMRLVKGRIKYSVTVKKNNCKETEATATADWVI